MSIRVLTLIYRGGRLSIYAWKNWFKNLCGLILMTVVFGHEDMPRHMYVLLLLQLVIILLGFGCMLLDRSRLALELREEIRDADFCSQQKSSPESLTLNT